MKIVIQTNYLWAQLTNLCVESWSSEAERSGYSVVTVDFSESKKSFIDLLIECAEGDIAVAIAYDDLFCKSAIFFPAKEVRELFVKLPELTVVHLDGRVIGNGRLVCRINDTPMYDRNGVYRFSTVFSVFRVEFLRHLKAKGIQTPWAIEKHTSETELVISPKVRNFRYYNLLVKGRPDLLAFYRAKFSISLSLSFKRLAKNILVKIARNVGIRKI